MKYIVDITDAALEDMDAIYEYILYRFKTPDTAAAQSLGADPERIGIRPAVQLQIIEIIDQRRHIGLRLQCDPARGQQLAARIIKVCDRAGEQQIHQLQLEMQREIRLLLLEGHDADHDALRILHGIGNIIRTAQSFGDYTTRTETKYNENGLVAKITEFEPNGKVFKTVTIEYDNYGDEVNRCAYKSGNQMIEYTYHLYSQEGRQLKTIYEDKIHKVKECTYYFDFDNQNNWQIEVKAIDNKIYSIRKRNFIYYPQ